MPNLTAVFTTTFFTIPEVAERLLVSRRTIYNLIRTRDIPSIKIGGQYRIPADALARRLTVPEETGEPEPAA